MTSSISPQSSILQGGLWTKGIYKEDTEKFPLITVITVVLNGEATIQHTIESIVQQTYPNLELIVIDGGSQDQTVEIIQSLDSKIDHWISEKDSGIYDAMNKGINLARGKWLNFMNSGDIFFSKKVVEKVFANNFIDNSLVIHGNWEVRYDMSKKRRVNSGNAKELWKGSQFCHQAVFIDAFYHKTSPYNTGNRITGDFEFFYKTFKNGGPFLKVSDTIASIEAGGVSDIRRIQVLKSWWAIIDKDIKSSLYFLYRFTRETIVASIKWLKV
jgi:glycosyltransferase involved in cell wall biosynthesis